MGEGVNPIKDEMTSGVRTCIPPIAPLVGLGERMPLGCECPVPVELCREGGCGFGNAGEGDGEAVLALANMESRSARPLLGV